MSNATPAGPLLPVRIIELPRKDLHITISDFHHKTRFDVRHYVEKNAPGMPLIRTKQGINGPIEKLPELLEVLQDVLYASRAAGILPKPDSAPSTTA
jgi:hypothetical protein